jgi:hypothetical protein
VRHGIRYFVMGFGYGDVSTFEQPVMERSGTLPRVIVINADPFFVEPNIREKRTSASNSPAYLPAYE